MVIDVQDGFRKAVPSFEQVARATAALVKGARAVGIPIVLTEQYPKGLGKTVPEVAEELPEGLAPIEKVCFSALEAEGFDLAARQGAGLRDQAPSSSQTALDLLAVSRGALSCDGRGSRFDETARSAGKAERSGPCHRVETALFCLWSAPGPRVQAGA